MEEALEVELRVDFEAAPVATAATRTMSASVCVTMIVFKLVAFAVP